MEHLGSDPRSSRREFLKQSTAVAAAGALAPGLALPGAYAHGRATLRLGLVGAGGRGAGAAVQALKADPDIELVAIAEAFPDRLQRGLEGIIEALGADAARKVKVDAEHRFVGFDAYQKVLDSKLDAVILAAPPGFRPAHFEAAIAKGVHVFAEKPVAVDAPGVRRIQAACDVARKNKISVVSGLCWRYDAAKRATFERVLAGDLGTIRAMQCTYNAGSLWHHGRKPEWTDMEWQVRNWLYFTWLSGDHIAEQHIHSLDKMQWAMGDKPPLKAHGVGGRQVRTDPKFGNVYDHFAVVYEYADGVKGFSMCRQQAGCATDVSDHLFGTDGVCDVFGHKITGRKNWKYAGPDSDMYQVEQDAFIRSIRQGKPIDDGDFMCKSTLMAIMGRMAAYTGQVITWEQAWNSQEVLGPKTLAWGELPVEEIAVPGVTKFA